MQRAVSKGQKEVRRQAILDVAWGLFQQYPYEAVNVLDVAKGAGLAKGTVYLYFKTKEELFLAILAQQFETWFDTVDAELARGDEPLSIELVADLLTNSLIAKPGLTRLFAILHVILEHNIPYDTALAFKQGLRNHVIRTGGLLEERLPFLAEDQGQHLLLRTYALVIGIQHLANPAPVVRQLLQTEPTLALFDIAFAIEFRSTFIALCHGMAQPT